MDSRCARPFIGIISWINSVGYGVLELAECRCEVSAGPCDSEMNCREQLEILQLHVEELCSTPCTLRIYDTLIARWIMFILHDVMRLECLSF